MTQFEMLEKAYDKSKLVPKTITDKNGTTRVVWVNPNKGKKKDKVAKKPENPTKGKSTKESKDKVRIYRGTTTEDLIKLAGEHGITWKESTDPRINRMRCIMALKEKNITPDMLDTVPPAQEDITPKKYLDKFSKSPEDRNMVVKTRTLPKDEDSANFLRKYLFESPEAIKDSAKVFFNGETPCLSDSSSHSAMCIDEKAMYNLFSNLKSVLNPDEDNPQFKSALNSDMESLSFVLPTVKDLLPDGKLNPGVFLQQLRYISKLRVNNGLFWDFEGWFEQATPDLFETCKNIEDVNILKPMFSSFAVTTVYKHTGRQILKGLKDSINTKEAEGLSEYLTGDNNEFNIAMGVFMESLYNQVSSLYPAKAPTLEEYLDVMKNPELWKDNIIKNLKRCALFNKKSSNKITDVLTTDEVPLSYDLYPTLAKARDNKEVPFLDPMTKVFKLMSKLVSEGETQKLSESLFIDYFLASNMQFGNMNYLTSEPDAKNSKLARDLYNTYIDLLIKELPSKDVPKKFKILSKIHKEKSSKPYDSYKKAKIYGKFTKKLKSVDEMFKEFTENDFQQSLEKVTGKELERITQGIIDNWDDKHGNMKPIVKNVYKLSQSNRLDTLNKVIEKNRAKGYKQTTELNPIEDYAYHGTNKKALPLILSYGGLRVPKSRDQVLTGSMLGLGIYLANSSAKAGQYACSEGYRSGGEGVMFICKTSLGNVSNFDDFDFDRNCDTVYATEFIRNPEWCVKKEENVAIEYIVELDRK